MPLGSVRGKPVPRTYSHMPVPPVPTPSLTISPVNPVSLQQNLYPNMQAVSVPEAITSLPPNVTTLLPIPNPTNIVRPTKKTMLPCSIHCPGVNGFPSLSCTSCHCLFHPKCVGLPPTFTEANANFDFYCNDCQPKIPEPPKVPRLPFSAPANSQPRMPVPARPAPRPSVVPTKQTTTSQPSPSQLFQRKLQGQYPAKKKQKGPPPPRPIESQTMVSIGGKKFLVIPRASIELDSPPPSPPRTQDAKSDSKVGSKKLPVLLEQADKPGPGASVPRFEVEQSPDGSLVLKPVGNVDPGQVFGGAHLKKRSHQDSAGGQASKRLKKTGPDFHATVSSGYFAFLSVLRYLGVEDRLKFGKVCRLWRELAHHHSLWTSLSLKNIKVRDWAQLGEFLIRVGSRGLDLRKMIFIKDREATWTEVTSVAHKFTHLRKLQLPRISGPVLAHLLAACPHLEILNSPLTTSPVNTGIFETVPSLQELRLKTGNGSLKLESGLGFLERLGNSLTSLSLLTIGGLTDADYDCIGLLSNLEQIELGDCTDAPITIFKTLSDLLKLQRIRLEKGSVGNNISKLKKSDNLTQLELIDFHVQPGFRAGLEGVRNILKLLIIPTYKDEVAKSNAEIVEGVTTHLKHLQAFYLGVTNEWLDAMSMVIGDKQVQGLTLNNKICLLQP